MMSDTLQRFEMTQRAAAAVAWIIANNHHIYDDARAAFESKGWSRFSDRLRTKAGVDAMLSSDTSIPDTSLTTAFMALATRESILGKIDGVLSLPIGAAARIQIGTVDASTVEEGVVKPIARMDFDLSTLNPTKVQAGIVVSTEFLRSVDVRTQTAMSSQLASATATATDAALITALTGGSAVAGSAVGDLFAAVSGGAPMRPYLLGGLDTLLPLATQLDGLRSLGITIVQTPAAAGKLIALDAAGLLVSDDGGAVTVAQHADVLMDDGQGSPSTTVVSLWQKNLAALRSERFFKFAMRADAVAWGSPS